ncbi:MAG: hypothetical protein QXU08_08175 [Ignisphaera sp.]
MSDYKKYTGEDAVRDFIRLRVEDLGRLTKIYSNISEFVDKAAKSISRVEKLVESVKCLPGKNGAVVVDPTKRLLIFLRIDYMSRGGAPRTLFVSMSPPLLPHFFLILAYLTTRTGFTPAVLAKTSPIVSLASILMEMDLVSASITQFAISMRFLENFVRYEVSILPLEIRYMNLPLKAKKRNALYLCELGLSTAPVSNHYNVEVDLSGIPPISDETLASREFISLRSVLDEVVGKLHE